jgi:chromatin remodeling complex protein RSC6
MPPTQKPPVKKVNKSVIKKVSNKAKVAAKPAKSGPAKSAPAKSAPAKSASAPAKVVETPPVADISVAPVENTITNYSDEFTHLLGQLRSLQTTLKELTTYTSNLEKRVAKDQRVVQKRVNGKKRRASTGTPSGFSKPGKISDELRSFLGLKADELVARTEVTKRINAYCKENGLQDQKDKRILKADKTLQKLLRLKPSDELTFFNLQKYMKVHFPNKEGVYPTA